jgi:hypothetical protein
MIEVMLLDYRIRPTDGRGEPLTFLARNDDSARAIYRDGLTAIRARGMATIPMTLERFDEIIPGQGLWREVRLDDDTAEA